MARVTVEDCLENIDNRFALVMVASRRTKQLLAGATPAITKKDDKPHVVALREFASNLIAVHNDKES